MRTPTGDTSVSATFRDAREAEAAVQALVDAGVDAGRISLREGPDPGSAAGAALEGQFLWRFLVIVVAWSIVGGAVGAGGGALLWLVVGPPGTQGLVIQVVCWAIFGHLIAGLWAGYALIADRTRPELRLTRGDVQLTVLCDNRDQADRISSLLRGTVAQTEDPLSRSR